LSQAITISGKWEDGASSAALPAQLHLLDERVYLIAGEVEQLNLPLSAVHLSPRIGRTPRYVTFDGFAGQLESSDHENLQQLDGLVGGKVSGLIDRLEQHLLMVVMATVVVAGIIAGYFFWGLPAGSKALAYQLPDNILDRSSRETLSLLEEYSLHETALSEDRQQVIREDIQAAVPEYPIDKLRFYGGGDMGANAFALPDGTIIFTDEIVELMANSDEVIAVFGHELAHVKNRHSLRQVIQGSALSLTFAMISGDVSALGDLLITAPVIFTQLSYSRGFELESDAYAVELLREQERPAAALGAILTKLHHSHELKLCDGNLHCDEGDEPDSETGVEEEDARGWQDYLSTHPHLQERIALTRETENG